MKRIICFLFILVSAFCFLRSSAVAEHPGEPAKSEHPGSRQAGKEVMLSAEQIIKGIKEHIASVTKTNNGYFPITDTEEGKDLQLKLIRVHEDKVSYIKKEDAYFACTDFVTSDGRTNYDLDFWMREKAGELNVYQTKIHKKDGNPRFIYQDDEIVLVDTILEKKGSGGLEGAKTMEEKGS